MTFNIVSLVIINVVLLFLVLYGRKTRYSGTMLVEKIESDDEITKLIYKLDLDEDPENFQYRKKVTFRVQHIDVDSSS